MARYKFLVVVRISDALEIATIDGFGLIVFGNGHGFEAFVASRDINITAHEIHKVRALQEELGHPSVVIVSGGNVAIAALFRFRGTDGMRHKRAEGLS